MPEGRRVDSKSKRSLSKYSSGDVSAEIGRARLSNRLEGDEVGLCWSLLHHPKFSPARSPSITNTPPHCAYIAHHHYFFNTIAVDCAPVTVLVLSFPHANMISSRLMRNVSESSYFAPEAITRASTDRIAVSSARHIHSQIISIPITHHTIIPQRVCGGH